MSDTQDVGVSLAAGQDTTRAPRAAAASSAAVFRPYTCRESIPRHEGRRAGGSRVTMTGSGLRVFLSATRTDLGDYRDAARHACSRLGIEIDAMEDFGPHTETSVELCRAKVARANLFLGLYAYRYGFTPDGFDGKSITELEYDWAQGRTPLPDTLAFVVDDGYSWPAKLMDQGEQRERLEAFKDRLRVKHVIAELTTPEQLHKDLLVALPPYRDRAAAQPDPPRPTVLPTPPEPYAAHKYTLLHTAQIIGRDAERAELDAWAARDDGERVLSIVAMGGMGKSALAWHWFHHAAPGAVSGLAGRFWWSFYAEGATFDEFVVTALAYCAGQTVESVWSLPPTERENRLVALLDQRPFLLVLDGLEHLMRGYGSGATVEADDNGYRSLTDVVSRFLRTLAGMRAGRAVITTRMLPAALETATGGPWPGSRELRLARLEKADAVAFWKTMGITVGVRAEFLLDRIDYYPLLIQILAGQIARFRDAPRDLDAWQRSNPDFDPFSIPLVKSKTDVLASALKDLSTGSQQLLEVLAAFTYKVQYPILESLLVGQLSWTVQRLDAELTNLEDRALIGWDRDANLYEMHPVVRGVVRHGLDEDWRATVYRHIADYLTEADQTRDGCIELMRVLIGLGKHANAVALYVSRLGRGGTFCLTDDGQAEIEISLLEELFPHGIDQDPAVDDDAAQGVIAWLGHAYEVVGRLEEALACAVRCTTRLHPEDVSPFLRRYVFERQLALGLISEAAATAAAEGADDAHAALCAAVSGDIASARTWLDRRSGEGRLPHAAEARIHLLCGDHRRSADAGRAFLRGTNIWVLDRLRTTIDVAEADLHLGRSDDAVIGLAAALRESEQKGYMEPELQGLRVLAEARRLAGDFNGARRHLDALDRRGGTSAYRLILADAAGVRAQLPDADPDERREDARRALHLAQCSGNHYSYHRVLTVATATLRELENGHHGNDDFA